MSERIRMAPGKCGCIALSGHTKLCCIVVRPAGVFVNENKIDLDTVHLLDHASAAPLIPPIGPRLQFLKKVADLKPVEDIQCRGNNELNIEDSEENSQNEEQYGKNTSLSVQQSTSDGRKRKLNRGNTVKEYLDCIKGDEIKLNYFGPPNERKETPFLDRRHQDKLTDIVIENELDENKTLTSERFYSFSKRNS